MVGKTIENVTPINGTTGATVLVFDDGSFVVASPLIPEPSDLREALQQARHQLEPKYPQAYAEYDRLLHKTKRRNVPRVSRIFSERFTTTSPISPSSKTD